MTIYNSTKVLPYVYRLDHKETDQFYIGFRCANKVPSSEDLGTKYFTSSKYIKELGFENFNVQIIAEFFDKESAINFENQLIKESWNIDGILNKNIGGTYFSFGLPHSNEAKLKMSKTRKGRKRNPFSDEWKLNISKAKSGILTGSRTQEFCEKMSKVKMGVKQKPLTAEHKIKLSKAGKGRIKSIAECEKISASKKGKKTGPWSEERKQAFREKLKINRISP